MIPLIPEGRSEGRSEEVAVLFLVPGVKLKLEFEIRIYLDIGTGEEEDV